MRKCRFREVKAFAQRHTTRKYNVRTLSQVFLTPKCEPLTILLQLVHDKNNPQFWTGLSLYEMDGRLERSQDVGFGFDSRGTGELLETLLALGKTKNQKTLWQ